MPFKVIIRERLKENVMTYQDLWSWRKTSQEYARTWSQRRSDQQFSKMKSSGSGCLPLRLRHEIRMSNSRRVDWTGSVNHHQAHVPMILEKQTLAASGIGLPVFSHHRGFVRVLGKTTNVPEMRQHKLRILAHLGGVFISKWLVSHIEGRTIELQEAIVPPVRRSSLCCRHFLPATAKQAGGKLQLDQVIAHHSGFGS